MSRSPTYRAGTAVFRLLGEAGTPGLTADEIRDRIADARLRDKVGQALHRLVEDGEVESVAPAAVGTRGWRLTVQGAANYDDYLERMLGSGYATDPLRAT
jgi:hypothetical protein